MVADGQDSVSRRRLHPGSGVPLSRVPLSSRGEPRAVAAQRARRGPHDQPILAAVAGERRRRSALPELGRDLARYAGEVTTIKLLLAAGRRQNGTDGFYYVASWPPVAPSNLEAERETLASQGVLDRLAENCRGEMPFSLIYRSSDRRRRDRHRGDAAVDRGRVLGGRRLVFRGCLPGCSSRPALLGDAAGASSRR